MTFKKKGEVEKMGEFVGNVVKQVWGVVKRFGKAVKEAVLEKKKIKMIYMES
jgi:hypothetical protein